MAAVLTLQPAFAAPFQYRLPLDINKRTPPAPTPPTTTPKPGSGAGDVDTGADPEAVRAPVLLVTPTALQFESNLNQSPTSQTALVANDGPVPTTVSGLESSEHFAVSHNCPAPLPVAATCLVTVTPKTAAPGVVSYRMGIIAPGAETQASLDLRTFERMPGVPYPSLSLSEDLVFLGELNPGQAAQGSARLTNSGNAAAVLDGIASGKNFTVTSDCPDELAPGASCNISAAFQAYEAKSHHHTLGLYATPGGSPTPLTFYASIKGNPAMRPALAFNEQTVTFGPLEAGASSTKKVVLTNRGTAPAELQSLGGNKDFAITSSCSATLPVNGSCEVVVTFNAFTAGTSPAYELTARAQDEASAKVLLSGQVSGGTASDETPAAVLAFEPEQHAFGNIGVGQTLSHTAKLTNSGPVSAKFSSIVVDAGAPAYRVTHTCGTSLAPSASCDVTVTFSPTAATSYPGRVKATPTGAGSALLSLSGTGEQAQLSVGPANVDFGTTVELNPSAPRAVYLSNSGNVPLTGLAVLNSDNRLTLDYGSCTSVLEPKKGCALTVRYAPSALGTYAGDFKVTSGNGGTATVAWSGMAVSLRANPSSLTFPSVRVSTSAPDQTIQLSNGGPTAIPIDSMGIYLGQNHFGQSNNCGSSLGAGASCTVTVRFTPSSPGAHQGTVNILSKGAVLSSLNLSGAAEAPKLVLTPGSVRFADTNVGQASPAVGLTVSNPTNEIATLTGIGISSGASEFAQSNNCGSRILAGQSCTVTVQMTPASTEGSFGSLAVLSSFGEQTASLSGIGTKPAGGVEEQPAPPAPVDDGFTHYAINFLDTQVGYSSAVRHVKFTNRGDGPLSVAGVSIVAGETDYSQTNNCGGLMAPGAYCTISLLFSPSALGERIGGVALTSDGGNFYFDLKGKGIGASGTWRADSSADYGSVGVNSKNLRSFTFSNSGTIAATGIETVVEGENVRLTANTCGAPGARVPLAVGSSCRVTVEYSPAAVGDMKATLKTTGTLANDPATLDLSGKALSAALAFDASPSGDFGSLSVGTSNTRTYYLRNVGPLNDTLAAVPTVTGQGFTFKSGSCASGTTLPPNGYCTVIVNAAPTATGPASGSLSASTSQGASASVTLSATGIQSTYEISSSPSSSAAPMTDFGVRTVGGARVPNSYLFLRDSSKLSRLSASKVSIVGDPSFALSMVWVAAGYDGSYSSTCSQTATQTTAPCEAATAGQVLRIGVDFNPGTAGVKNAVLRIEHNGTGGVSELPLTGESVFNATAAWSTSVALNAPDATARSYGLKTLGTVTRKTLYFVNTGTNGAQATGLALSGDTSQFKVTSIYKTSRGGGAYNCGGQISPTAVVPCSADDIAGGAQPAIRFDVEYVPTAIGEHSLTLTATTNNGTKLPEPLVLTGSSQFNPTATWSSTATGAVTPLTDAQWDFGTLAKGTETTNSTDRTFYLRNTGTSGGMGVGFTFAGDTSAFRVMSVQKVSNSGGSITSCTPGVVVSTSGATPCQADDIAGGSYPTIQVRIRFAAAAAQSYSASLIPTTSNGTILPGAITLKGAGAFDATTAWSNTYASTVELTSADLTYGTKAVGTTTAKTLYLRNSGSYGSAAVGVTLTGDVSHFKISQVGITSTGGSNTSCMSGGVIDAPGSSVTPCVARDAAAATWRHVRTVIQYVPKAAGNHSINVALSTSNGTALPGGITMSGSTP